MARLLIVSRSMALSTRLADQHQVSEHPVGDVGGLLPALQAAEAGPGAVDVLVLDLGDPVQAVEAVNSLREAGSGVPVLLVSGYQPEWEEVEQQDVEGVRVVPLPITRASLLEGVTALLPALEGAPDESGSLVQIGAGAGPDLERGASGADTEDMRRRNRPNKTGRPSPAAAEVEQGVDDGAAVVAEAEAAVEAAAADEVDDAVDQAGGVDDADGEPGDDVTEQTVEETVADETAEATETTEGAEAAELEVEAAEEPADDVQALDEAAETEATDETGATDETEATDGTGATDDADEPEAAAADLDEATAEHAAVPAADSDATTEAHDQDATPARGLPLAGSAPTAPPWEQVVAPAPRLQRWTRGPENPPTGPLAAGPGGPGGSNAGRARPPQPGRRMFQRRPQHGPTIPGTGLVTDPLGPRTDPYGFSSTLDRRLDEDAGALVGDAAYRDANGVALRTHDLIRALIDSAQHLYGVADTAQVLADDVIEKADADAAAVLIPDGPAWRVSGGVGLRPLERRLVLEETHWLITEIGLSGRAVLIDDTDFVRQQLSGAPLAAWRHLLAVPIPEVHGIVVLARGQEGGPFSDRDLSVVISPVREAAPLIAQAIETRRLARLLNPLREQDSSA